MFTRFITRFQMRQSTAFLLTRADNRLLDDIGLSRAELQALHIGALSVEDTAGEEIPPSGRALPVAA